MVTTSMPTAPGKTSMPTVPGKTSVNNYKLLQLLKDSTWVTWKGQIMPLLKLNRVWDHMTGTAQLPDPTLPDNDPLKENYESTEQITRFIITCNLSSEQFIHVSQLDRQSAHQMWENLQQVHKLHGQQSVTALRWTLYHMRAKEGEDIVAHITKMRQYQVELHQMGSLVSNDDFRSMLITSLLPSWDHFTSTYLGTQSSDKKITSQELITLVCNEYK
ncbi:hypothetical protein ID866_12012 [Astraeus odoratus]|nr:hypothetical protein ID866_12012 [Astraeus odoratus]